jgi:cytochrome c-type biogenesis protein CcmF
MIVELGHFALVLALVVALVQMVVPFVGAARGWRGWMAAGPPAATAQFLLVLFAFGALAWSFVASDFSVALVQANSHSAKPWLFKLSGTWGNHEGSMLLWLLILALFGAAAGWFGGDLPETLRARVLSVQASIGVAFGAFLLWTSNPFARLASPPLDGRDLNPLLQDVGLALHPPFLYLGYVGLSMAFSFAVAALLEGRVDAAWGRWVRPWTLAAWTFLTVGIALGSWWAYYELGWGGFWFWDPVENASFMPWLLAAALLHSAAVTEKREALKAWTILLAILAFGFSLLGTFIVRSGVLTSVHAFASDPARGVVILAILAVFVGGALSLFAARAGALEARGAFALVSRESALVLNNVLLAVAALVVFVGTLWPLLAEMAFGRTLSVGPPFFEAAFTPFMVALAIVLPVGSLLAWKRGRLTGVLRPLLPALLVALLVAGLAWTMGTGRSILALVGAGLGAWLVAGAMTDLWLRAGRTLGRLPRLPGADWGRALGPRGLRRDGPGRGAAPGLGTGGRARGHPRRALRGWRLLPHAHGRRRGRGAQLPEPPGRRDRHARRRPRRPPPPREALLSCGWDADHRGGHRQRPLPRPVRRPGGSPGRRGLRAAHLRQALLSLDLGRLGAHGAGGPHVAP